MLFLQNHKLKLCFLLLFGCVLPDLPALAQTSFGIPQTIQLRVFNAVSAPTTFVVPNVGQSIHYVQYVVSGGNTCGQLAVNLQGSNDGTNFFAISETATDSPNGGVYASGYFPVVRVNLSAISACAGGTLTAFYSATSSGFGTPLGIFGQSSGLRKVIAQLQPVNTPVSPTIGVPLGSSQGRIYLACFTAAGVSATCPSGGSFTVAAVPSTEMPAVTILSIAIGTVSSTQIFDVPATSTNNVTVTWSGFAASAVTLTAYYQFSPPGSTASGLMTLTTGQPPPSLLGVSGAFVSYSPTQLGANAITLPASGFVEANIIDTRGVRQATILPNCGQTFHIALDLTIEDGVTLGPVPNLTSGNLGGGTAVISFGSESGVVTSNGTASTTVRFPQRAFAVRFVNETAVATTCTARMYLAY